MEVSRKVICILLLVIVICTLGAHQWTVSPPSSTEANGALAELIEAVAHPPPTTTLPPTTTEEPETPAPPTPEDAAVALALGADGCGLPKQPGESHGSNCPPESLYVSRWAKRVARPTRKEWTIFDVGCNKGFPLQEMLEAIGLLEYRMLIDGNSVQCGACADCKRKERYPIDEERVPKSARIFAYDINDDNVNFTQRKFTNVSSRVTINVTAAALSANASGTIEVDDGGFADELTRIRVKGAPSLGPGRKFRTIPVTTVDAEIARHGLTHIDILLTDTEGHDYIVADGAWQLLASGRVGLYLFETWGTSMTLAQHVARLHNASFKCYFPQTHAGRKRDLVPISGACWRDDYNIVAWSNVVCANKLYAPELVAVMDELATTVATAPTTKAPTTTKNGSDGEAPPP